MKRRRVLLVEDNQLLRWWLTMDLYGAGFRVAAPDNLERAITWADTFSFDALITDWRLSADHDGMEMLRHVRAKSPSAQAILISAEMNEDLADKARTAGFDLSLTKPFTPAELLHALQAPQAEPAPAALAYQEVAQ